MNLLGLFDGNPVTAIPGLVIALGLSDDESECGAGDDDVEVEFVATALPSPCGEVSVWRTESILAALELESTDIPLGGMAASYALWRSVGLRPISTED